MNKKPVQLVALAFLLVPLPLVFYGVHEGIDALWWAGVALMIVGGMIPPISRYVFDSEEEDEGSEAGEDGDEDEGSEAGEDGDDD